MSRPSRLIDYRTCFWGHNHTLSTTGPGILEGFCWYRSPIREGDRIIWKTNYGQAIGEVTESRRVGDPHDMYRVKVKVVERQDASGRKLVDPPGMNS